MTSQLVLCCTYIFSFQVTLAIVPVMLDVGYVQSVFITMIVVMHSRQWIQGFESFGELNKSMNIIIIISVQNPKLDSSRLATCVLD